MIPYKEIPMFHFGPIRFNMYGIMFAVGVLLANLIAVRRGAKAGIKREIIDSLVFVILGGAIIGARLFYVMFYWPEGIQLHFTDIFKVWEGGLAFYGGFIGAVTASILYLHRKKISFFKAADVMTIPLIAGHISGRIGDYLTGGHPGKISDLPWSIYMKGALRHPVVLYEILGLLLILLIVSIVSRKKIFEGFPFLLYVQLYAIQRIILDVFRIESTDPRTFGMTPTQIAVLAAFVLSSFLMALKLRKRQSGNL